MEVRNRHTLGGLCATALLAGCATNTHPATAPKPAATPPTATATATSTTKPATPGAQTQKWIDLQVGQCVLDLPPADLSRITVTMADCAAPHLAEVYLRAPVAVDAAIGTVANEECAAGVGPYTGKPVDGSSYTVGWLIDSHQDRTGADPNPSTVICLLQGANGQLLTGSARRAQ